MANSHIESILFNNLDLKQSVRAATVSNITLSGPQQIDGVSLSVGNRVLVKNQNSPSQNGIYVVKSEVWSRAQDADDSSKLTPGLLVFVEEGSINSSSNWQLVTASPITLGSTNLVFSKTGERGPAGETGPQGERGIQGNTGPAGSNATATTNASDLTSGTLNDARLSGNVVLTNDARLTNARTPTSHASSHATGGSDAITPANIGAAAASHTHSAADLTSGTVPDARLSSAVALHSAINAYNSGPSSGFDIYPRGEAALLTMSLAAGGAYFTFFTPVSTITVSSITMVSGTGTVSSGITLARMGLYTFDETTAVLVARTASDTTLFSTINTAYNRSFSTVGGYPASYQLTAGTRYGIAIIFVGTQAPTGVGRTNSPGFSIQTPRTTVNVGSQSDLPTTASSFGIQQGAPFARLT
jgi:hypothetical protein